MIVCSNCGKKNQEHYKFCLGCGGKLAALMPRPEPSMAPSSPPSPGLIGSRHAPPPMTTPAGPAMEPSPVASAASAPTCGSCGMTNPVGFAFCGRCGSKLQASSPVSPSFGSARTMYAERDATGVPNLVEGELDTSPKGPMPPAVHEGTSPASATAFPTPAAESTTGVRIVMLGSDGQPVGERLLAMNEFLEVGREAGPPWADDAYLDARHATLVAVEQGVRIDDHDSLNGIFIKLKEKVELLHGDHFRVGQELLLYEDLPEPSTTEDGTERMGSPNPGYWGRLSVLVEPDHPSAAFPVGGSGVLIGRESGDITFAQDGYVSGKHCRVTGDDQGVYLEDLGSSNGTYVRVRPGQVVGFDSLMLIGQKLFRVEDAG